MTTVILQNQNLEEKFINLSNPILEATESKLREMDWSAVKFDMVLFDAIQENNEGVFQQKESASKHRSNSNSSFEINLESSKKKSKIQEERKQNLENEIKSVTSKKESKAPSPNIFYPAQRGNFKQFFTADQIVLESRYEETEKLIRNLQINNFNQDFETNYVEILRQKDEEEYEDNDYFSITSKDMEKELLPFLEGTNYDKSEFFNESQFPKGNNVFNFYPKVNLEDINLLTDSQIVDNILELSKNQKTSRQLQQLCESRVDFAFKGIFPKVLLYISEMLNDNFSNFLLTKLVSMSDSNYLLQLIIALKPIFVEVASSNNGSILLQAIIEKLNTKQNLEMFTSFLLRNFPIIIKNPFSINILKKFISCINHPYNQPIYDFIIKNVKTIGSLKKGGNLLELALDLANKPQLVVQ